MLGLFRHHILIGLLYLLPGSTPNAASTYPFSVSAEKVGEHHQIIARNRGPAPVSVQISLSAEENISSPQGFPILAVIRPNSETTLATVRPLNPARAQRFSLQTRFHPGNFHAIHDGTSRYRLPFPDGNSFVISQAPGGPLSSHNTPDSFHAIDFTMPELTPVVAARSGIVISTESGNRYGGKDSTLLGMANHIRILHADDTIATYAHLAPYGVLVGAGQRVQAGSLIGHSGSTGYSSGPHLHFVVHQLLRKGDGFDNVSVPIKFYVGNPAYVFTPEYLQKVTAEYQRPGQPPPFVPKKTGPEAR